jgi:hypothetical protein
MGPKHRNKPKKIVIGFAKQTENEPKQIEFRFVSVRTEKKICLFRGRPILKHFFAAKQVKIGSRLNRIRNIVGKIFCLDGAKHIICITGWAVWTKLRLFRSDSSTRMLIKDASNVCRDVPNIFRDVPNALRDVPHAFRDAPNAFRDAPNIFKDAPNAF